jgi:hypothetical protein
MTAQRFAGPSAVLGVLVGTLITVASPASASPSNCATWPNPANATNTSTVAHVWMGDTKVELRFGYLNGRQAGWARLANAIRRGDKFWLDVSSTRGNGWIQCGPFTWPDSGTYTPAHYTSSDPNTVFRACGRTAGSNASWCTGWI